MNNKEFNHLCAMLLERVHLRTSHPLLNFYASLKLQFKLSAYQIYKPTIMCIGGLYHQYQMQKYEKLIGNLPTECDQSLYEYYIEKYEAHLFATKYGRAYKKEYRDWCLKIARQENISPLHLPFLIWNGDLNPRNKTFLKGTALIIALQGFFNLLFSLMMANGLLLMFLAEDKPLLLRLQAAILIIAVTMLGWTFYNPYSIGLYNVTKHYKRRNY